MRVAKNYQKYATIGEPYQAHGYWYTKINLNGQLTEVRLYNDEEYEKMYPSNLIRPREALGFNDGYITLITGKTDLFREWLTNYHARFHKIFGWYFPSTEPLPEITPEGLKLTRLAWDTISINQHLKPDQELTEIMNRLIYGDSLSHFVGQIGERFTITLTVKKVVEFNSKYGRTYLHIMKDINSNIYTWTTNTRALVEDQEYSMTATIKNHEIYGGQQRTVLTRCVPTLLTKEN